MAKFDPPAPPYLGPVAHSSGTGNKPINRIVIHCTVSACAVGAQGIAAYGVLATALLARALTRVRGDPARARLLEIERQWRWTRRQMRIRLMTGKARVR